MQAIVKNADAETSVAGAASTLPECDRIVPPTAAALPLLRREGIRWSGGVNGEDLVIELEFENPAARPTRMMSAIVQIAEFGAFVPWRPLTVVRVPPIPPGGRRTVTTAVDPDDPKDLAIPGFGRHASVNPRPVSGWGWHALLARLVGTEQAASMPHPHFVGNLNVFVPGSKPVERHVNRTIKLDPDNHNLALFIVGDGVGDEYRFSFESDPPGWDTRIERIEWNEPVRIAFQRFGVSMKAPDGTKSGRVTIWVERVSTSERVPVEFELAEEPDTANCYRL